VRKLQVIENKHQYTTQRWPLKNTGFSSNLHVFVSCVWAWVYWIQSCECPKISICNVSLSFYIQGIKIILHSSRTDVTTVLSHTKPAPTGNLESVFFPAVQITLIRETASNSELQPLSRTHVFWKHTSTRFKSKVETLKISLWKLPPQLR